MRFLIAAVVIALLLTVLYRPLKKYPLVFYVFAIALGVLYAVAANLHFTGIFWTNYIHVMQRCTLAFLMITVVMFVGVLPEGSRLRARLMPIRRQLSIMACLLALCHVAYYLSAYAPILSSTLKTNTVVSLALSVLLVLLLLALFVTSFTQTKTRMSTIAWKRVQKLAYPFYLLVFVHLSLFMLPAMLSGKQTAVVAFSVYASLAAIYVVLRLLKWRSDLQLVKGR